jgi:hypothetical protein
MAAPTLGPEEEIADPAYWDTVLAPDVDDQDWNDYAAIMAPEEGQTADLFQPPHARMRPDIPHQFPRSPTITGIPIDPDSPAGNLQAKPLWLANAVVPRHRGTGPMIAIVIDDAGIAQKRTARAIALPAPNRHARHVRGGMSCCCISRWSPAEPMPTRVIWLY